MMKALASKQEVLAGKEREIEVLKENYETAMRLNKQSTDCVRNLEDALEKVVFLLNRPNIHSRIMPNSYYIPIRQVKSVTSLA